jgi:hypothetical protein
MSKVARKKAATRNPFLLNIVLRINTASAIPGQFLFSPLN